ncbi:MAG: DNA repair protein RecN, partial [Rhodospirillaceae bacterium]|nr:DNA repair protein RecN [Rhodospirillaceae bacterium]
MLISLSIRDVVLVERLDLSLAGGLSVLTGETGAGKSILLDALGLALGARGEKSLVRRVGGDGNGPAPTQASVVAEFSVDENHPAVEILRKHELELPEAGDSLILRRVLTADGRSRAFVNDQSISIGTLRALGEALVEIEGQFASQGLLDVAMHRPALDAFGGFFDLIRRTAETYETFRSAETALEEAREIFARAREEEEFLRHAVEELAALDPQSGEEAELAARRGFLMNGEKLTGALADAISALGEGDTEGVETRIGVAQREISRFVDQAGGRLDDVLNTLNRAAAEIAEAEAQLEKLVIELDADPAELERAEERLFTLRAVARKHGVDVEGLPALRAEFENSLGSLDDSTSRIEALEAAESAARAAYLKAAEALSVARLKAAKKLDKAVAAELPPLKLEKALFRTTVERALPANWGPSGIDRVVFEVATNPGQEPGSLAQIASGGELARFTLALKVALSETNSVSTLVFDEVDSGIGGATAAAVGERLEQLADRVQVLVVTHSPQVAARGTAHWRVVKGVGSGKGARKSDPTTTTVDELVDEARREEIARMLAGAKITDEARAAADS